MRSWNLRMKPHVVHALVAEVRRVVVEAEGGVVSDGLERPLGAGDVERDLGRMHFERELHALLLELVEDGLEALGEILVAVLDLLRQVRREAVDEMPDATSR